MTTKTHVLDRRLPKAVLFLSTVVVSILLSLAATTIYSYKTAHRAPSSEDIGTAILAYPVFVEAILLPMPSSGGEFGLGPRVAVPWLIYLTIAVCAIYFKDQRISGVLYGVFTVLLGLNTLAAILLQGIT